MSDTGWIASVLAAARPQAMAALVRRFRDIDVAEEAYQEACLRALKSWPKNGPPRDAAAWLIMVGRNAAIDSVRKLGREQPLPQQEPAAEQPGAEAEAAADRIDEADYRDDILRLLFVCCHPELPATQQIALALRIVSGLSVKQIARAFLVSEAAMEQRITRAKARIADADVPFETPGAVERGRRIGAVASMVYLLFNEGYTSNIAEEGAREPLCEEAIRLARLLLRLFPADPEMMGLLALLLFQHARADARFTEDGTPVLLEDQDRRLWDRAMIGEGHALVEKAVRHRRPGPFLVQAGIAALHAGAPTPDRTNWDQIEFLYGLLEQMMPSPVVTLNRAVAVSKVRGPAEALAMLDPLEPKLRSYFYYHGARGAFLEQLGRKDDARQAFNRAIALANNAAEAAHIRDRIDQLSGDGRSAHLGGRGRKPS